MASGSGSPVFSPDGETLYYKAMKRPGFEADRFGIMVKNLKTGATHELAPRWDRSVESMVLSADGKLLYVTAQDVGQLSLFAIDTSNGTINKLVDKGTVSGFDVAKDKVIYALNTLNSPDQLYRIGLNGGIDKGSFAGLHRAAQGADDAGGERGLETERIANGKNFLAHLQSGGIAEGESGKFFPFRIDLDQGDVVTLVGSTTDIARATKAIGVVENYLRHANSEAAPGATYVGAEGCKSCHPNTYTKWAGTNHAKAYEQN